MKELHRSPKLQTAGPGGLGSLFDDAEEERSSVLVNSGPFHEWLPVSGMTVGEVRSRFRDVLGLPPDSQAVLDGRDVADDTVIRTGQSLTFSNRVGEKGSRV